MKLPLEQTLVLCDLDALLLDENNDLPQVTRDVIQLFQARGGRLTVFSQRTPRAVRTMLGSIHLAAPALLCGGALLHDFSTGTSTPLASFAAVPPQLFASLPCSQGFGVAMQMADGATRVVRMSQSLACSLRRDWTPCLLQKPEDLRGGDILRVLIYQDGRGGAALQLLEKALVQSAAPLRLEKLAPGCTALLPKAVAGVDMLSALCSAAGIELPQLAVAAASPAMLELVRLAGSSIAAADAPAELRVAAQGATCCNAREGAAAEYLYELVRAPQPV